MGCDVMKRGKMQRVVSRKKVVKQSENEEGKKMGGIGGESPGHEETGESKYQENAAVL